MKKFFTDNVKTIAIVAMVAAGGTVYMLGSIVFWCVNKKSIFNDMIIRRVLNIIGRK